jgi:hypothetical protein
MSLGYRVIEKRNFHGSIEMSFFAACPYKDMTVGPDKSGHRPPFYIIVKSALRVCPSTLLRTMSLSNGPDLRGTLRPPIKGHDAKKGISILFSTWSLSGGGLNDKDNPF